MNKSKAIPISAAKKIAELGYDEIIIFGANYESGVQHITTYGKTLQACENAAVGGNAIKKLLGWDADKCNAKPARVKKKEILSFSQGYACALVSMIVGHGLETPIVEAWRANFGRHQTPESLKKMGIDVYDIEIITPHLAELNQPMELK